MECKFLKHGIALSYDHVLKPCCEWRYDQDWSKDNHVTRSDIATWHHSLPVKHSIDLLGQGRWPQNCSGCRDTESQGRFDSVRGNGNRAYAHYRDDDITLEIRPGSTCNFACQTCWPEASSRVAQYQHQAGLIDIKNIDSTSLDDFSMLEPIRDRIQDVVLLGGEPFYDKSCRRFLDWALQNLKSRITLFTNGSAIDFDFVSAYQRPLCIVVSLDATGIPAEYVRFGTNWSEVWANYQQLKNHKHVELRVNITLSMYNYLYVTDLIELLCQEWPACVTFGHPRQPWLNESALPDHARSTVVERLSRAIRTLETTEIETGQKHNAINALTSVIENVKNRRPWNQDHTEQLKDFCDRMDRVKKIQMSDYCPELFGILNR